MTDHLTGLIAAPHTPMHADGRLNLAVVERQAKCLADNGIRGVFVCGSTGEGLSLTSAERRRIAERWRSVAPDTLAILVHVGHHSVAEAKALARHAEKMVAARAIACMGPSYLKPANVQDLAAFCAEVAAAAPNTPFYYYHQPANSGLPFAMEEFLKAAAAIPTLAGVKYTHGDMIDFANCVRLDGGRFDILLGDDESLLAALAVGARGAIGGTYNFAAPLYHRVIAAYEAGRMVMAQQQMDKARQMVRVLDHHGGPGAVKAAMKAIGIDCGPCRVPLRGLSQEQYEALRADLERIGFFTYCSKPSAC